MCDENHERVCIAHLVQRNEPNLMLGDERRAVSDGVDGNRL